MLAIDSAIWAGLVRNAARAGKSPLIPKEVGLMAGQTTVAELSAAIVHQLREPLTSTLANAQAAKRWLAAEPPNLIEALACIDRIARDARAAGETMDRIQALFAQAPFDKKKASIPAMMSEALRLVLEDPNKREVQSVSSRKRTGTQTSGRVQRPSAA